MFAALPARFRKGVSSQSERLLNKIVAEGDLYYSPMPFIAILNVCCSPNPLQERSFLPKRAAIKKNSRRRRPLLLAHAFYYYPKCLRLSKSASGKELLLGAHGCPRVLLLYCSPKRFTALLCVLPLSQSAWIRVSSQRVAPNFF